MGLRIVMLGAPGAGKGTQAKRIAAEYDLPHISTGDIFRANLSQGTDLGKQVKEYLDSGRLVPDELTCEIVADRIAQPDCAGGYVLDGFPRSVPQADTFQKLLAERGDALDMAIDVDVPDNEIIERLTARRFCGQCGAIYNLKFDPPTDLVNCSVEGCDGKLEQRSDDREATIRQRLEVYHETTEPIIDYYRERGVLKHIDGAHASPDEVYDRITAVLNPV